VADVLERVSDELVRLTGLLRDLESAGPVNGPVRGSEAADRLGSLLARASTACEAIAGPKAGLGTALIGAGVGGHRGAAVGPRYPSAPGRTVIGAGPRPYRA
jgi:hypothetical protein